MMILVCLLFVSMFFWSAKATDTNRNNVNANSNANVNVPSVKVNEDNSDSEKGNPPSSWSQQYDIVELKEKNHVILRGEVSERSIAKLIIDMSETSVDNDEILMYIVSPGGSVIAGNNLIQYMNFLRQQGKTLTCIADLAASMAFRIFQECDNRLVMPTSILMQHQMSVGLEDQYENLKNRIKLLEAINRQSNLRQAARIGLTPEEFQAKVLSDWWIYGEDNMVENTADKTVLVGCSPTLAGETTVETLDFGLFSIDLLWSSCPLSRFPLQIGAGNCTDDDKDCQSKLHQEVMQLLKKASIRSYF